VGTASFIPRQYVERGFGHTRWPKWTIPRDGDEETLRLAVVHHEYSFAFWASFRATWETIGDFCATAGIAEDRFSDMQRGQVVMQPTDVTLFIRMLAESEDGLPTPADLIRQTDRALSHVNTMEEKKKQGLRRKAEELGVKFRQSDLVSFNEVIGEARAEQALAEEEEQRRARFTRISERASGPLRDSMITLASRWLPDYPAEPTFAVDIEAIEEGRDPVDAMPTRSPISGVVRLGEEWGRWRERCPTVAVDGHFILTCGPLDERGRPVEVDALRLLPTAWSPAVPPPCEPEYASSPATIRWTGDTPELVFDEEEPQAAATWVARYPPEVMADEPPAS
jgi:hypothetical protein